MTKAPCNQIRTSRPTCRAAPGCGRPRLCLRLFAAPLVAGVLLLSGCASEPWSVFRQPNDSTASAAGSGFILGGDGLFKSTNVSVASAQAELEKGKELFSQAKTDSEYARARTIFHRLAAHKKTPASVAEEALYQEAECQRLRSLYPSAAEIYTQLVTTYPRGRFHRDALQRMFDIANYWLDETRDAMNAQAEVEAGKRQFVMPASFIHLEKSKPFFDMRGRALVLLEKIYLNDIDGPMGEVALFYLGNISLFQENYAEADHFYAQIVKFHPNGQYAPKALKLCILCKQMSSGGPLHDGRTVAEARELVHQAKAAYPELAHKETDFLQNQLVTINLQQAEKDMNIAEFYRRTGHPGSAYFYYELVRRRYPGSKQAEKATQRMAELKDRVEREQNGEASSWSWFPNPFAKKSDAPAKQAAPVKAPGVSLGQPQGYAPPSSFVPPAQGHTQPPLSSLQKPELAPAPKPAAQGAKPSPPGATPAAYVQPVLGQPTAYNTQSAAPYSGPYQQPTPPGQATPYPPQSAPAYLGAPQPPTWGQ